MIRPHLKRAGQLVLLHGLLGLASLVAGADTFVHPGLLQSREDLVRMKTAVDAKSGVIFSGFEVFRADPASQLNYKMRGPLATVGRNPTVGQTNYDSDANAAYQCALMWCLTGDLAYAKKAEAIVNAWSATLLSITGRDAVLMAGLGPFKMVNAAELLRHTGAGWVAADVAQAELHFRTVVYPVIKDFAPFANGNWDTAAIKTMMAIAVFCDDRPMFDRALDYYVDGAGDGRLTRYIINGTGQCQESGRDQQHTQLGLAHLGDCCEMAWHQGLDLYAYDDNLLLKGFEYTARYNLGEEVPFATTLDRTGKYRHTVIATMGRGSFRAVFEEIYNHYANVAGVPAPDTQRAAERIRPEHNGGSGADHVGFGTLLFTRPAFTGTTPLRDAPVPPAGIIAEGSAGAAKLTWVAARDAKAYTVSRAAGHDAYQVVARNLPGTTFTDTTVTPGGLYRYVISASNATGASPDSTPASVCAGLPAPWVHQDVGSVAVAGAAGWDGDLLTLEGAGAAVGGRSDQFHFVAVPLDGDGTLVARFVPQPSSQFSQFGLMMRATSATDAAHVALLISPAAGANAEAPGWRAQLTVREAPGAATAVRAASENFTEPMATFGRLTGVCWLKLARAGDNFAASMSDDGQTWTQVGTATVALPPHLLAGLPACSHLAGITTIVKFDHIALTGPAGNFALPLAN